MLGYCYDCMQICSGQGQRHEHVYVLLIRPIQKRSRIAQMVGVWVDNLTPWLASDKHGIFAISTEASES